MSEGPCENIASSLSLTGTQQRQTNVQTYVHSELKELLLELASAWLMLKNLEKGKYLIVSYIFVAK
ncbi:MAG: hypothetical protein ACFFCW_31150 [Candidatus Hodarchaeota archaeon]